MKCVGTKKNEFSVLHSRTIIDFGRLINEVFKTTKFVSLDKGGSAKEKCQKNILRLANIDLANRRECSTFLRTYRKDIIKRMNVKRNNNVKTLRLIVKGIYYGRVVA
jgi:hypothetical protein